MAKISQFDCLLLMKQLDSLLEARVQDRHKDGKRLREIEKQKASS